MEQKSSSRIQKFEIASALETVRHLLPSQGAIQDFVHHNTLHAFQDLDFETAVLEAADLYGARAYLPIDEYRSLWRTRQISDVALAQEVNEALPEAIRFRSYFGGRFTGESFLHEALRGLPNAHSTPSEGLSALSAAFLTLLPTQPHRWTTPRAKKIVHEGVDVNSAIQPTLFRLIGSYLDQGISYGHFPRADEGFFCAVGSLVKHSVFPLAPFMEHESSRVLFSMESASAASVALALLCPQETERQDYVREALLAHPGWSGLVSQLEEHPTQLRDPRPIRLLDFLAVQLIFERQAFLHSTSHPMRRAQSSEPKALKMRERDALALASICADFKIAPSLVMNLGESERRLLRELLEWTTEERLCAIWQRALERTTHTAALAVLEQSAKVRHEIKPSHEISAVFCIDDRECSLRRYLEEDPHVVTDAAAGFFGIDFVFQSLDDAKPVKLCPLPVKPQHVVTELHSEIDSERRRRHTLARASVWWNENTASTGLGWLLSAAAAPFLALRLAIAVIKPDWFSRHKNVAPVRIDSDISFMRTEDRRSPEGFLQGYTIEEMADRVGGLLLSTGLIRRLGRLVALVAHGSSSTNNPHFAAYDCGACSGRPGAANAKVFARMANLPEVRNVLVSRGILVPHDTHFVGGFHDTCKDSVVFFDTDGLDPTHAELLERLRSSFDRALGRNARERLRRFESIKIGLSPKRALQEARRRASALFEPRPELNHATNAFCIVGRRSLTETVFFDRRAFLHSYDPTLDPTGVLLKNILSAVVPVCAGINLEYFFSRIDNEVYGAGTKLPHNVASLLGVMNGVDGDLRTGLPRQMIELHDPVRLLFVVECEPEKLLNLLETQPSLQAWFDKRWANLAAIDPATRSIHRYNRHHGFEPMVFDHSTSPQLSDVDAYVTQARDNLPFALIRRNRA